MLDRLREAVTGQLMRVELVREAPEPEPLPQMEAHHLNPATGEDEMALADAEMAIPHSGAQPASTVARKPERNPTDPSTWGKVGRNEACPCGSGKKFKHCHGRLA